MNCSAKIANQKSPSGVPRRFSSSFRSSVLVSAAMLFTSTSIVEISPAVLGSRSSVSLSRSIAGVTANDQLDIFRYWIQDRFVRTVSLASNDTERLEALETLLRIAEANRGATSEIVNITSLKELELYRFRYLHPESSTQNDIEKFRHGFYPKHLILTSTDPVVQAKIIEINQAYSQSMDHKLSFPPKGFTTRILTFTGIVKQRDTTFFNLIFEDSNDSKLAIAGIRKLSLDEKKTYLSQFGNQVADLFSKIRNSGTTILENFDINLKDPRAKRFVELVLSEYFKQLPDETIWSLIFSQMERPELTSLIERFGLVSHNVGPQFHKLFQMLASDPNVASEAALVEVFKSFEDNLPPGYRKPVADMIAKTQFEEFTVLEVEEIPVKVASMSQIHRAKVKFKHNGEIAYVALSIPKPGIETMLAYDNKFLDGLQSLIAKDPLLSAAGAGLDYKKLIDDLKGLVLEELDSELKHKNQLDATTMLVSKESLTLSSGKKVNIVVPKGYRSTTTKVIASDWIYGQSFREFYASQPESAREVSEVVFQNWLEKAIFRNGFVHADLQAGNILVSTSADGNTIDAHLIDYGMAGVLPESGRHLFILLALGTSTQNSRIVARALWEQSTTRPDVDFAEFESGLKAIFEEARGTADSKLIDRSVEYATKSGFHFDSTFIKLVRGFATAHGLLKLTQSSKTISSLVLDLMKKNPGMTLASIQSAKYLKMEDIGQITKSVGLNLKDLIVNRPDLAIEAGKKAFGLGKGLFDMATRAGKAGVEIAANSEAGKSAAGRFGGFMGKLKAAAAQMTVAPTNSCRIFYDTK